MASTIKIFFELRTVHDKTLLERRINLCVDGSKCLSLMLRRLYIYFENLSFMSAIFMCVAAVQP